MTIKAQVVNPKDEALALELEQLARELIFDQDGRWFCASAAAERIRRLSLEAYNGTGFEA